MVPSGHNGDPLVLAVQQEGESARWMCFLDLCPFSSVEIRMISSDHKTIQSLFKAAGQL